MSMFGQNKPLASLSSTLLARKGTARPAMRPQGFGGFGSIPGTHDDLGWNDMGHGFDPNGFDPNPPEQQYEQPGAMPPVAVPQVLRQREALQEGFEAPHVYLPSYEPIPDPMFEPEAEYGRESETEVQPELERVVAAAPKPVVRSAPAPRPVPVSLATAARIGRETSAKPGKSAFTLRLDHGRHLRLRLASALQNVSAQHLVTEALDAFLQSLPEVEELACQLPSRSEH
jgi:hypothetical protein